jgi:hypothetical protein
LILCTINALKIANFQIVKETIMKQLLSLIALILLVGLGCKDDPTPTPVNLCDRRTPFKADFDICESTEDSLYVTDTIANFEVWIRTNGTYDSVKIKVGDDPKVFTAATFKLNLNDSEIGQTIPVKMIGFKKKDSNCFAGEKTVDSLTKSFVVICSRNWDCAQNNSWLEYPFVGKFKGFNSDEPNKEFVVTIVNFGPFTGSGVQSIPWNIQVYNLPNGCGGFRDDNFCGDGITTNQKMWALSGKNAGYRSFRSLNVPNEGCCSDIRMWGHISLTDRNTITIWHRKYDRTNPRKFVGKRV